jgi:hypothetical protein
MLSRIGKALYCVWKLLSSIIGQVNPKKIEFVYAGCPLNTHL